METEVFIQSFSCNLLGFIKIEDLPFLVLTSISLPLKDLLVFKIFGSRNIENSVVMNVGEVFTFIDPELPPARVSAPDLQVVASSIVVDVN
jgi:hypothetical protein